MTNETQIILWFRPIRGSKSVPLDVGKGNHGSNTPAVFYNIPVHNTIILDVMQTELIVTVTQKLSFFRIIQAYFF